MESWDEHQVTFEPAEGLENNETSVRVLDQQDAAGTQGRKQRQRIMGADPAADPEDINDFQRGLALESKIREDPGYKFLMMVSAFASRRLGKLVSSTNGGAGRSGIDNICAVVARDVSKHWMQEPEISGVIYLSPDVYGHIKEGEELNPFFNSIQFKLSLIEFENGEEQFF